MALDVPPLFSAGDLRGPLAAGLIGWDDIQGGIATGVGATLLANDAFSNTPFRLLCFRHTQDDSLSFTYQMPHRWQPGTVVRPHLHYLPLADPAVAQNIRFAGQYVWVPAGTPLGANAVWTPFTIDAPVLPGDINQHKIAALPLITPPATAIESSVLCVFWIRNGLSGADTYTTNKASGTLAANVGLLSADCHVQVAKGGTNPLEFPTS